MEIETERLGGGVSPWCLGPATVCTAQPQHHAGPPLGQEWTAIQ